MIYKLKMIGCKPFSINNAYYKRTFTHTKAFRAWRETIFKELKKDYNQIVFEKARAYIKYLEDQGKTVAVKLHIRSYIESSYFWTLKKTISKRSMDLSNTEKGLIDIICNSSVNMNYNLLNLDYDDKNIVDMGSSKRPSKEWKILVNFEIAGAIKGENNELIMEF